MSECFIQNRNMQSVPGLLVSIVAQHRSEYLNRYRKHKIELILHYLEK